MWIEIDCMDRITAVSEVEVLNSGWQKYEGEVPENYWDYVVVDGKLVYEPMPEPAPEPEAPTQLDRVEAQTLYTALMTDTLIEEV